MTALIPQLVRASGIQPVQVSWLWPSWLWPSWLPVGKLVLAEFRVVGGNGYVRDDYVVV